MKGSGVKPPQVSRKAMAGHREHAPEVAAEREIREGRGLG
jgi:hypothetical protein